MEMLRLLGIFMVVALSGVTFGQMEEMRELAKSFAKEKEALTEMEFGSLVTLTLGDTVVVHGGETYDGVYFKAPDTVESMDFVWYFNAPENWANWYILPLEGDVKQAFKDWLYGDLLYKDFDKAGEKDRFRALQTLDGSYFEMGKEYVLWFRRLDDAKPGELRLKAVFAEPEEGKWGHEELEKALSLKPKASAAQIAELDSLGGRILLDREFFNPDYADGRIDSLFFAKRQQKQIYGGFFVQISTSTPPCDTEPKLADIIAKYGEPDFVRSSEERSKLSGGDEDEEKEVATVTHYYDYFGFVVEEGGGNANAVLQVMAQANDFSKLRPEGSGRSTFGQLRFENLTVFHFEGKEVGRIYRFDEDGKEPLVVTAPPEGSYQNGSVTLNFLGDGMWTMEEVSSTGKKAYTKRFAKNRLDGLSEVFHENGELKLSLSYKEGVPDGRFAEYDEEGRVVREAIYKNGELVK